MRRVRHFVPGRQFASTGASPGVWWSRQVPSSRIATAGPRPIGGDSMAPAPWWVTIVVGVLTVSGAFFAARMGAKETHESTEQRDTAAAREEWFRRLQWATDLTLKPDDRSRTVGFAVLSALALSPLAGMSDLDLLWSLNTNA